MNRLKVIRAEKKMTQFRLALISNITQSRLSYLENSLLEPTEEEKTRLARALAVTVEDIFPENQGKTKEASGGASNES